MPGQPQFGELYRRFADDELARLALTYNLAPEAQEALTIELRKRGLTDLSEHKSNLTQAAASSSLENQLAIQGRVKWQFAQALLTFMAWVMAPIIPFAWVVTPEYSDSLKISLIGALFIAFSCYLGIRSRREGSRWGCRLEFLLPLILLGISTVLASAGAMFF